VDHWQRLRRAYAYATGRLSADDAQTILIECQDSAGWYPLSTLCTDDLFDHAIATHGDPALKIKPYLPAACEYVSRKWEAGDDYYSPLDFAFDTARDYAAQDGIDLGETEDPANLDKEGEHHHA